MPDEFGNITHEDLDLLEEQESVDPTLPAPTSAQLLAQEPLPDVGVADGGSPNIGGAPDMFAPVRNDSGFDDIVPQFDTGETADPNQDIADDARNRLIGEDDLLGNLPPAQRPAESIMNAEQLKKIFGDGFSTSTSTRNFSPSAKKTLAEAKGNAEGFALLQESAVEAQKASIFAQQREVGRVLGQARAEKARVSGEFGDQHEDIVARVEAMQEVDDDLAEKESILRKEVKNPGELISQMSGMQRAAFALIGLSEGLRGNPAAGAKLLMSAVQQELKARQAKLADVKGSRRDNRRGQERLEDRGDRLKILGSQMESQVYREVLDTLAFTKQMLPESAKADVAAIEVKIGAEKQDALYKQAALENQADRRTTVTKSQKGVHPSNFEKLLGSLSSQPEMSKDDKKQIREIASGTAGTLSEIDGFKKALLKNNKNISIWGNLESESDNLQATAAILGVALAKGKGLVGNLTDEERELATRLTGTGGSIRSFFNGPEDYVKALNRVRSGIARSALKRARLIKAGTGAQLDFLEREGADKVGRAGN